jgi:hypothetical protein
VFVWRYLGAAGEEIGESDPFGDRDAAEAWMGEAWSDLRDREVEQVALEDRDRGRTIYRMDLGES